MNVPLLSIPPNDVLSTVGVAVTSDYSLDSALRAFGRGSFYNCRQEAISSDPTMEEGDPPTPKVRKVDPNFEDGAGINYTIVPGCKQGTKLVDLHGYLYRYRSFDATKEVTHLRCRHMHSKVNPCQAKAKIRRGYATEEEPIRFPHTCSNSTEGASEAHRLTAVMKTRALSEGTTLKVKVSIKQLMESGIWIALRGDYGRKHLNCFTVLE